MTSGKYMKTEMHKKKIGLGNKGKIILEETKEKLKKSMKQLYTNGYVNPMKGKKMPTEIVEKLRIKAQGRIRSEGFKNKHIENAKINPNYGMRGRHHKDETKKILRKATISYMQRVGGGTVPCIGQEEKQILDKLQDRIGFSIKRQFYINGYWLDGYCQELNLAIEVDEEHHYVNDKLREEDIERQLNITKSLNCNFIRIRTKLLTIRERMD